MNKSKIGLLVIGLCLMMVVASFSGCVTEEEEPEEMVLIFGSSGDAKRLDPGDVTDGESIQRMDNIFESRIKYYIRLETRR